MVNKHGCLTLDPLTATSPRPGLVETPPLEKRLKLHLKEEFDSRPMIHSKSQIDRNERASTNETAKSTLLLV
jgi:hypothetical protein